MITIELFGKANDVGEGLFFKYTSIVNQLYRNLVLSTPQLYQVNQDKEFKFNKTLRSKTTIDLQKHSGNVRPKILSFSLNCFEKWGLRRGSLKLS